MKTKDKQRQLLIELMNTDHDSGLYDLSREDVEQIIRTCGNPKKLNQWIKEKLKSVYIKF
jgi:Leu/Phe-tRNA-protein transferase